MRANMSPPEKIIWRHLSKRQLCGVLFTRQKIIAGYIADFAAPKLRLVIEVDGKQHETPAAKKYDEHRDMVLNRHGWTVIRIPARAIFERQDDVRAKLEGYLIERLRKKS